MKKIFKNIGILALALGFTLTSCNESFLEAVPETDLSDATVFVAPDRVLAQVNGLYGSAKNGSLFGGRYLIYNDIRAEEFINRTTNTVTGYTTYQGNQDPADTYIAAFWSQSYLTINRINLFLEGLEENSGVVSADLATNYRGEAKFIRALTYFGLVQFFATPYAIDNGASPGLPLRLTGETTSENNDMPRSTVAQVYDQILKDLNDAEGELPSGYSTPLLNTTRAHKNTAIALKTRVLLAKKDYQGVIAEANKIVSAGAPFQSSNGVSHALLDDVVSVFRTPYTSAESILSFPMSVNDAPGTQNQLGYYFNAGNLEYYINESAPGIYAHDQFGENDARRTELMDDIVVTGSTLMLSTKFSGVSPYIDFVPNIRYAEVLLNLAEAEAEAGDQARAKALLEAVHHRSDADYDFGNLDKDGLVQAILTERRIELFAEGFRANDILRRGEPIDSFGAGTVIQPNDKRYFFAIPVIETVTNKAI